MSETTRNSFSGTYRLIPDHWEGGFWGEQIWQFTNSARNPLTYTEGLVQYRPDRHFFTDLKSTPTMLQAIAPQWFAKDGFPRSTIFHDSAYVHHGVYVSVHGVFEFRALTRKQADEMLYNMVLAEGGSKTAAMLIYAGVRAGGSKGWNKVRVVG